MPASSSSISTPQLRADELLVIYVSPWEYDRTTDTKAALIGAVLGRLDGEIRGDQTIVDTVRQRLSKLRERINITKAVTLTRGTTNQTLAALCAQLDLVLRAGPPTSGTAWPRRPSTTCAALPGDG
jgi:hypothetical protein